MFQPGGTIDGIHLTQKSQNQMAKLILIINGEFNKIILLTKIKLISIFLYTLSAFFIFLMLLNRFLILLQEGKIKFTLIILFFVILHIIAILCGYYLKIKPYIVIPIIIISLIFIGEIKRYVTRNYYRGSKPYPAIKYYDDIFRPITTTNLKTYNYKISIDKRLEKKIRIVHLTDFHINKNIDFEYYKNALQKCFSVNPDYIFITGDFISDKSSIKLLKNLFKNQKTDNIYAVLGNHDYWVDSSAVTVSLEKSGINVIKSEPVILKKYQYNIVLYNYNRPWAYEDIEQIKKTKRININFVLTHTPDNIYTLSDPELNIDAVFAGHYHAGQIRLPVLGSIVVPSIYGRRFDHGHFKIKNTHLFVPSGIGASGIAPRRIYCNPDFFVIDIFGKNNPGEKNL